jgi:Arc/MetJ family transcription regulator
MKTTVHITDALLKEAQTIAARDGTTLKELVDEGLRKVIKERKEAKPFKLEDGSVHGEGLSPEFRDATFEEILAASYGLPRK